MALDTARLLAEVLALPGDQRRRLVAEVLASLEPPAAEASADVAASWADEIHERLERRGGGAGGGVVWSNMRDDMLAELRKRRAGSR